MSKMQATAQQQGGKGNQRPNSKTTSERGNARRKLKSYETPCE